VAELAQDEHLASPAEIVVFGAVRVRAEAFSDSKFLINITDNQVDPAVEATVRVGDGFDEASVLVNVDFARDRAPGVSMVSVGPVPFFGFGGHVVGPGIWLTKLPQRRF
jgi:hypothetical protein